MQLETNKFSIVPNDVQQHQIHVKSNQRTIFLSKAELRDLKKLISIYLLYLDQEPIDDDD